MSKEIENHCAVYFPIQVYESENDWLMRKQLKSAEVVLPQKMEFPRNFIAVDFEGIRKIYAGLVR